MMENLSRAGSSFLKKFIEGIYVSMAIKVPNVV